MKNWETTLFGLIGAIGVSIVGYGHLEDFPKWVGLIGTIMSGIGVFGAAARSRDANKTSEKVGLK